MGAHLGKFGQRMRLGTDPFLTKQPCQQSAGLV
jgi:hypothetical protein